MNINEYQLDSSSSTTQQASPSSTSQIIRFLRWAGSLLIILSAIGFMVQSHADLLPDYRYWVGLAIVLALCTGGVMCNYLLKELTGARLFFALGAAFLPVQVSQVSAMLYNYFQGAQALHPEYSWLQFANVNQVLIALDLSITVLLLIVVSYTSFAMLAKRQLKLLMQTVLIGNLILLLPIRDGYELPIIIALLYIALNFIERKFQSDNTMKMAEGLTARALISLPFLLLVGRSLLYPFSFWIAITIAAIIASIGIVDVKRYTQSALVISMGQAIGTVSALSIWFMAAAHFEAASHNYYSLFIPFALLLIVLSTQVLYCSKAYRCVGSVLATWLVYIALLDEEIYAPLLALSTGIALVVIGGLKYREKITFFCGQLSFLGGILFYCGYVVDAYSHAPWLFSIGLGVIVLILASILEKKHQILVKAVGSYLNELKDWG